jgi:hypothetical protein
VTRQLTEGATARLVRDCRRHRVTLNSVMSTAMLIVVNRHLYGGEPTPLRHITFTDLRPWLEPAVEDGSLGCCIGMVRITQSISTDRHLWNLAPQVNDMIHRASKRGDKFIAALMVKPMMKMAFALKSARMAASALSYMGVVDPTEPGVPVKVRSLHTFVSNFTVGPEFVGMARITAGRMQLDLQYLDSDMDADTACAMADDMVALLVDGVR